MLACWQFAKYTRFDLSQVVLIGTYFKIRRCTAVLQVADLNNNQQLAALLLATYQLS
jgi:hypothetical protein